MTVSVSVEAVIVVVSVSVKAVCVIVAEVTVL